jgi:hypothetical protein
MLALLAVGNAAHAATVTSGPFEATDNSTIKPAGPRAGTSNQSFFNIEGSGNGTNASYGVADFSGAAFGISGATAVSALTLTLTESNAAFTVSGPVAVYLAGNATANIDNSGTPASTLTYTGSAEGVEAAAFGGLTLLGTYTFPSTGNATATQVDTVTFNSLSSDASTALAALLNTGGSIRLVFTPEDAATAATSAGFTNTTLVGPQLSVTTTTGAPVPEPASLGILLALGGLLLAKRRSR